MSNFDIRDLLDHAAAAEPAQPGPASADEKEPRLSPLAERMAALPVRPTYSPVIITGAARLADIAVVLATGYAALAIYIAPNHGYPLSYLGLLPVFALATVAALQAAGLYHIGAMRSVLTQAFRVLASWSVIFLLAVAALFFTKTSEEYSRVWLLGWYGSGLAGLFLVRLVLGLAVTHLTRAGRLDRRTVIVGGGEAAERLIEALAAQRDTGVRICGFFDDRSDDRSPDVVAGYPKLGTVDDLVTFARRTQVDLIIFTLPITAEARILQMLRKLWVLPTDIRLAAHMSQLRLRPRAYSYIGSVPVLDVFDKPIADWDLVLKWLFDKVVGAILLMLLSPLLLLTALAVKLDSPGPVLFRQKRYGFNNELIEVFKFRSMYVDQSDATAARLVTKGDPRVTRVGRIIRKTSLDELPQLFNVVFKGNLSLVGPRPHALHAKAENRLYDKVVDGYFARHKVKPGITGWAQINGWRGETDTEEKIQRRVEHDLFYIENWSVLFDLVILLKTPPALLKSENAY
ncbi:Undecaprenyl-phosphate glucose phosphotransferase [Chelatococcus caeni]|uniref:Undecaprenyl-phosphate glucose phosphotransferase n=1 Tax=Chelatococcus caeni TaxID=1348468 RepID=A0A840BRC7_9HYPH|nr:undecaprenyl-phosphate glucose phosphotransferase [Chelatococcus caeni]MBB4015925.1 Undecaprenyl-phosphate glucose phosphotransferase [Chelatococcus caeni]